MPDDFLSPNTDRPLTENPYASPVVPATPIWDAEAIRRELQIASQGKRFLNMVVDSIIVQVLSWVVGFAFGAAYVALRISTTGDLTAQDEATLNTAGFLLGLLVYLGYFVIMEALFQRTLAKFLTGTLVVAAEGGRPSIGQIIGRSFARFIPFEAFSFLGRKLPVGWHDSLSGTRVVLATSV